jgi:hypothetical protein
MSLDGIENVELFSTLKEDTHNRSIPTIKQLGKKVYEDCAVSQRSLLSFLYLYYLSSASSIYRL